MARTLRIPLWLKIFFLLMALSLVATASAVITESLLLPPFLLFFVFFPGKNPAKPRMFTVAFGLWSLGFLVALGLLIANWFHIPIPTLDQSGKRPEDIELWLTVLSSPPAIWGLAKRASWFRPFLVVSAVLFLAMDCYGLAARDRGLGAIIDFASNVAGELILTIYLWLKLGPRASNAMQSQPLV